MGKTKLTQFKRGNISTKIAKKPEKGLQNFSKRE